MPNRRSRNYPQIVKSLYSMKLRYVSVICEFCDLVYSSRKEIKRLNAINQKHLPHFFFSPLPPKFHRPYIPEDNYIDCALFKNPYCIVCENCADCFGGVWTRYMALCAFEANYRRVSEKLL